jgi:hypothetical protein
LLVQAAAHPWGGEDVTFPIALIVQHPVRAAVRLRRGGERDVEPAGQPVLVPYAELRSAVIADDDLKADRIERDEAAVREVGDL